MKIVSKKTCMTTDPQRKWRAGEEVEIDEKTAERLLINKNFYLTRQMIAETGEKTNGGRYRKKR